MARIYDFGTNQRPIRGIAGGGRFGSDCVASHDEYRSCHDFDSSDGRPAAVYQHRRNVPDDLDGGHRNFAERVAILYSARLSAGQTLMRVVVSGGGTGGHIFPAIAVAESVKRLEPNAEVLYIGGTTGMETQIVPKYGVQYQAVTAKKLRKVVSPSTVGVMFSLLKGYSEAKTFMRAFKADAVVGTGGYVAAATTLAGVHLKLPTVILESNFLAGRTNKHLAKWVETVCLSFEETAKEFPMGKTIVTGLPLRAGIVASNTVTNLTRDRYFRD